MPASELLRKSWPTYLNSIVYGSNGTGKTTISKVIAEESQFDGCRIVWKGGTQLETMVYNRDFVDQHFNQFIEVKGIFTLGEKDKGILDRIETAKQELDGIVANIEMLRGTLEGEESSGGKRAELEVLENEFEEKCWTLKLKHDEKLRGAFTGVRGKKRDFKAKLLEQSTSNSSSVVQLVDLEKKAETVFGKTPQTELFLKVPEYEDLLAHELDPVLIKKIVGKSDVNIAAMIQKLSNSDWVKQGREFYEINDGICPFCQQTTDESFAISLNDYFDEAFEEDTTTIETLYTNYKSESERLEQSL